MQKEKQSQKQNLSKITRIIPKAYQKHLTLVSYLTVLAEPSKTSSIIALLREELGDENYENRRNPENPLGKIKEKSFLKRAMKIDNNQVSVLVCKQEDSRGNDIIKILKQKDLIKDVIIKDLPQEAPLTKSQYQQWSKIWPINFIQHEISKQVHHSESEKSLILDLCKQKEVEQFFYLYDPDTLKVLMQCSGTCQEGTIDHPLMRMLQSWPQSQIFRENANKYYYLTHLKIVAVGAICGMCSMALVHSRLHSIYFNSSPTETMQSVMGCPKLNHQINMFLCS